MNVEHDFDDPQPVDTYIDAFWGFVNRFAEETLRWMRAFGFV